MFPAFGVMLAYARLPAQTFSNKLKWQSKQNLKDQITHVIECKAIS